MSNKTPAAGAAGFRMRATRRIYVVRGSELVDGSKQTLALPTDDKAILSAEPVVSVKDTSAGMLKFEQPSDSNITSGAVYFALADAMDFDVIGSGKLPAIFAGDKFEIETPFFDTTKTYTPGEKLYLMPVGDASIGVGNKPSDGGCILTNDGSGDTVLTDGSGGAPIVVGIVTQGVLAFDGSNLGEVPVDGSGTTVTGGPRVWANDTGTSQVLRFSTAYAGSK